MANRDRSIPDKHEWIGLGVIIGAIVIVIVLVVSIEIIRTNRREEWSSVIGFKSRILNPMVCFYGYHQKVPDSLTTLEYFIVQQDGIGQRREMKEEKNIKVWHKSIYEYFLYSKLSAISFVMIFKGRDKKTQISMKTLVDLLCKDVLDLGKEFNQSTIDYIKENADVGEAVFVYAFVETKDLLPIIRADLFINEQHQCIIRYNP